jgi:hypothetical protein
MTAVLGLPLALALGILADAVAGLAAGPAGGERAWWRRITDRWGEVRRLTGPGRAVERASVLDALGAGGSMLGAGIAAAAALVEPAFVVALGVSFLRWGTVDLEAVRGAQEVLGAGVTLGPGLALAGLILGAVVVAAAGALRIASVPSTGPAGSLFLAASTRWAAWGATAAVAGALLGGPGGSGAVALVGTAGGAAVILGLAAGLSERAGPRLRIVGLIALMAAAGAGSALMALA